MPKTVEKNRYERILEVSDVAAKNVKRFLKRRDKPSAGLRIRAERNDCGCLNYQLNLENNPRNGDLVTEEKGLKIFIDAASVELLRGTKMDFAKTPEGGGFTFNNPNDKHNH